MGACSGCDHILGCVQRFYFGRELEGVVLFLCVCFAHSLSLYEFIMLETDLVCSWKGKQTCCNLKLMYYCTQLWKLNTVVLISCGEGEYI